MLLDSSGLIVGHPNKELALKQIGELSPDLSAATFQQWGRENNELHAATLDGRDVELRRDQHGVGGQLEAELGVGDAPGAEGVRGRLHVDVPDQCDATNSATSSTARSTSASVL